MSEQNTNTENIGLILLAAGASTRLGHPKQLLVYQDQTLLQHSLHSAQDSMAKPVVLVLGAHAESVQAEIKDKNVHVVENLEWVEGMASSIKCGIKKIQDINPAIEGLILMVCDQPYVTSVLLNDLIATHLKTGKQIVASGYDNTFGPPVFFHKTLINELLQLEGDIGARNIVREHIDRVALLPFAEGTLDIDTEADYQRLKSKAVL